MRTLFNIAQFMLLPILLLVGCKGSEYGRYTKHEYTVIKVRPGEQMDMLAFSAQEDIHNSNEVASSRGLFDSYGSTAAGLIFTGVKTLVQKEKEKYHEEYNFVIEPIGHHIQNDSFYFYKSISDIPFNPSDMQFSGFTILRICGRDTALKAVFEVDKTNLTEIFYDGIFRLKLKELEFNYARAKVYAKGDHRVNLDFNIQFFSSFISNDGRLNKDVNIGNFSLDLTGVYLHNNDSCKKYIGKRLTGYSFLVPRSYGYSVQAGKAVYNQGAFSIHVNVKETAKAKIVNKYLTEHSEMIFEHANMNMGK
jgi:hypothetical protein